MLLKHNNNSISNVTSFAQVPSGEPVLLSTATASSSASIEFNSTYINSDYKIYKFEFINIHPGTNDVSFKVNFSTDNGSNYNVVKTTTQFQAYHDEADTATSLNYTTTDDLAQSTADQIISGLQYNNNDSSSSGYLHLFNPSSTTFVKHFISRLNYMFRGGYSIDLYTAGYGNTTNPINSVRFSMSSGNIDAGQIKLYGIGAN